MNQRMQKALYDCQNHQIGLDDTFSFKCRACGRCCENRDDILLTARDLFNIAQFFSKKPGEIVARYCKVYTAESSRIPVIRLKPRGPENVCPLLLKKRCVVQSVKPVVCALHPIGRAAILPQETAQAEISEDILSGYFLPPVKCGSRTETNTVRNWLGQFGIPLQDEFFSLWTSLIIYLSEYFTQLEAHNTADDVIEYLRSAALNLLYLCYDTGAEFMPQFRIRVSEMKNFFTRNQNIHIPTAEGVSDGE